ncbi:PQ loop repeat protein [Aspergillus niger]|uniref:PQ loop repeat protein n=1 Tax=Aspergillus niger TaxID=5061 RepID=A0A100ITQ1_ASPNG|nr:PQ loop repeat protein [Aspergillus niger]
MSASTDATPASNVLGTIGTVFWCIQLVPQIWYNWRRKKTEGLPPAMGFLWAVCAVPMGVYLILQIPYNKGITWPDILVGAIATVLLAGGMLPIYFELGKRQGRVIGINWVFLCIDTLGGLFSIFALVAQGSFDILGGVMYIVVVVLELGIYLSHIIWRIRFREARKDARLSGRNVEDVLRMSGPA